MIREVDSRTVIRSLTTKGFREEAGVDDDFLEWLEHATPDELPESLDDALEALEAPSPGGDYWAGFAAGFACGATLTYFWR